MAMVKGMERFYSLKRILGSWRRGRRWLLKYRAGGRLIMRQWIKENAGYLERLRTGFVSAGGASTREPLPLLNTGA